MARACRLVGAGSAGRLAGGARTHHLSLQECQQVLPGPLWPEGQADDAHPRDSLELPLRLTRVELRAKEIEGQVRPDNKGGGVKRQTRPAPGWPPQRGCREVFRGAASMSDPNPVQSRLRRPHIAGSVDSRSWSCALAPRQQELSP